MNNDGISYRNHIIKGGSIERTHINASVRIVIKISGASESCLPVGIMESDAGSGNISIRLKNISYKIRKVLDSYICM